jgi:hypothetical protein
MTHAAGLAWLIQNEFGLKALTFVLKTSALVLITGGMGAGLDVGMGMGAY